jgi:hypothetical protein
MQHGEIQLRVTLAGEPQKLLTYWRGSLRETLPTRASVSIIRPYVVPRGWRWWWDHYDPSFHFEPLNRLEKKRTELSISDASLKMQPNEIEMARHLTDLLFDWLSQRRNEVPHTETPIANARISLDAEGTEELICVVEAFGDPEVLVRAAVGAVFLQGEPRRPDLRWIPDLTGVEKARVALGELQSFERSLADGQSARMRNVVDRVSGVFNRRLAARRVALNKKYTELWGIGSRLQIRGKPVTDDMLEGWSFRRLEALIQHEAEPDNPRGKTRGWRSDN